MSGFFAARFGLASLYQTLAVAMAVALVVHLGARRGFDRPWAVK